MSVATSSLRAFLPAALIALGAGGLGAQTAITSATTTLTDGPDSTANGYTYLNQTLAVDTFTAGGETYTITGQADTIAVRRTASGSDNAHIWYETTSLNGDRVGPHITNFEDALLGNNLAIGVHNLFGNSGSSVANVERLDLLVSGGFTANEGFAIPVFDFGTNPQHESFAIALVTAVDGSGNPTGYSALANTAPYLAPNIHEHTSFAIERFNSGDDTSGSPYAVFNTTNDQGPGGVIFTLDDFAVSAGTTIYGYSLFGYDVSTGGDTANLVDWTNATYFPTNTADGNGSAGGFDFAGVNGIFFQDVSFAVVPEPATYLMSGLGVVLLGLFRRRGPRRQRA